MDRNGKRTKQHFKIATPSPQEINEEEWEAILNEEEDPKEKESSPITVDDIDRLLPPTNGSSQQSSTTEDKAASAKPKMVDRATSDDDIIDLVIKELSLPNTEELKQKKKKIKKPVVSKVSVEEPPTKINLGDGNRSGSKIPRALLAAAGYGIKRAP